MELYEYKTDELIKELYNRSDALILGFSKVDKAHGDSNFFFIQGKL